MSKKILILDGDSIAYRCAAAAETRFISVNHKPSGRVKTFKHRTELKKYLEAQGKTLTDDFEVTDDRMIEPFSSTSIIIDQHIKRIVKVVNPDEVKIFAGEKDNFRLDLPLPYRYKGNRTNNLRPVHLDQAKNYLRTKYKAEESVGKESDDDCSIAAYEALSSGNIPIMYFYEKDQYQLDGITLLHDNNNFEYETIPVLGSLRLEKTAVKGLGLKFLAYQWICSDPVDNYCAYDLSSIRFGAKSAYKVLNDCTTEQEVLLKVINQFKVFYPDRFMYKDWQGLEQEGDWLSMMKMYYKCCRMMRTKDDKLDCFELFNNYGVNS